MTEEDKARASEAAREEIIRLEGQVTILRNEMLRRGESFVAVLSGIKTTVNELTSEARSLSDQISYLSMQQQVRF